MTGGPTERKLFSSKKAMTFVQDGAQAHTSKVTQTWCHKNLPKMIPKGDWPANSPDLNPMKNSWSIIDEITYRDSTPKTLDKLKKWPRFAWKNVTQDTLKEPTHSMACWSKNVGTKERRPSWLLIFQSFNVKWIRNNILNFREGTFSKFWNKSRQKIGTNFWNTLY